MASNETTCLLPNDDGKINAVLNEDCFDASNASATTPVGYYEPSDSVPKCDDQQEECEKNCSQDSRLKIFGQFLKFVGPAVLISVGYVDPGNWATDIAGGAVYQYKLLWVLVLSNAVALVLQSLAAKLGLVTGTDLARQCANYYPQWCTVILWALAELAIAATDLAEVLGTAIGLNLLFKLPLIYGVLLTACDTLVFLVFHRLGHRFMELFIFGLMSIISVCFIVEMFYAKPIFSEVVMGLIPTLPAGSLPVACGILGATIMPHNIYLHSGLILSRRSKCVAMTKRNIKFAVLDGFLSLNIALFVNAAILIVSGATFFDKENKPQIIQDAFVMLKRYFGQLAAIIFAVGLLCAGQSSTITGTLSGQIVMEGFIQFKMRAWLRRLITRLIAIVPAVIVIAITGDDGTFLLVYSQVVLSIQLPFAMIPLIRITAHSSMGVFKNHIITSILGWFCALIVVGLNIWLLIDLIMENVVGSAWWVWLIVIISSILFVAFLIITTFWPIKPKKLWNEKKNKASVNSTVDSINHGSNEEAVSGTVTA